MASAYHGGITIHDRDKYIKDPTVLDTFERAWVIDSRTIIPTMVASNVVGRAGALVGLPDCEIGIQMSVRFFPLVTLRGPDQVGIRSFLSLVSWERSATSSVESSPHHNSIATTACSLGHTEPSTVPSELLDSSPVQTRSALLA